MLGGQEKEIAGEGQAVRKGGWVGGWVVGREGVCKGGREREC